MNAVQEKLFEILCYFDEFCRQHDLGYYLADGTVLGAVRHQGFIPWDDDIDVLMTRDQYERFLQAAATDLDTERFFLQNVETEPTFPCWWSKIRMNNTTFIEEGCLDNPMHQGLYMDIFVLDAAASSRLGRWWQRECMLIRRVLGMTHVKGRSRFTPVARMLKAIFGEQRVYRFFDRQMTRRKSGDDRFYYDSVLLECRRPFLLRSWFGEPTALTFEGRTFPGPGDCDAYLKHLYGEYWKLPPADKQGGHHHELVDIDHPYTMYTKAASVGSTVSEG